MPRLLGNIKSLGYVTAVDVGALLDNRFVQMNGDADAVELFLVFAAGGGKVRPVYLHPGADTTQYERPGDDIEVSAAGNYNYTIPAIPHGKLALKVVSLAGTSLTMRARIVTIH